MAKVSSYWYQDGDGAIFHVKNKTGILLPVLMGQIDFNMLKNIVMKPEWLDIQGEALTPSMHLMYKVRAEYVKEIPKILKGVGWINRLAITRLVDFITVLHKSDEMYYERIGYMMGRCIQRAQEWIATDKIGRQRMLHEERELYFTYEKRMDRVNQLNAAWDVLEQKYATDIGIERSVNFVIESLYRNRQMYNPDEISRLNLMAFHPEHWYPNGRGQVWNMMHGGKG